MLEYYRVTLISKWTTNKVHEFILSTVIGTTDKEVRKLIEATYSSYNYYINIYKVIV